MNEYEKLIGIEAKEEQNEYDVLLNEEKKERGYKLRSSVLNAQSTNPDEYAQNLQLAKQTGLPVGLVERKSKKL